VRLAGNAGLKPCATAIAVRLSAVARMMHSSLGEIRRSLGEGGKPDTTGYQEARSSVRSPRACRYR
jgi:hypothetical protein